MSVLTSTFTDIANAIRAKTSTTITYKPIEMANAINSIATGGYQIIHASPTNLNNTPNLYYQFNTPVKVADDVRYLNYTFNLMTDFDSPVDIGNNVVGMYGTFLSCLNFNQPITIPSNVVTLRGTFSRCVNFNAPITFIDGNEANLIMDNLLVDCTTYNQPITIPSRYYGWRGIDANYVISSCPNFNAPITFSEGLLKAEFIIDHCTNFNQPLTIPNGVLSVHDLVHNCQGFNQPVMLPDSIVNMEGTFYGCYAFNQPTVIPDGVSNLAGCFGECRQFNQPVDMQNCTSISNMRLMFYNCNNLNSNIYLPKTLTDYTLLSNIFSGCTKLNGAYSGSYIYVSSSAPSAVISALKNNYTGVNWIGSFPNPTYNRIRLY